MLFVFRKKIHDIKLYNNPDLIAQNPEYTTSFKYIYTAISPERTHMNTLQNYSHDKKKANCCPPFCVIFTIMFK